jgi:hypothetical protein
MSPAGEQAPVQQKLEVELPASATAVNNSGAVRAPFDGTITDVSYVPVATITGANTNTRAVSLVNHAQDGTGTAIAATLQFNSGVNATGFDEKAITLSGTPANLAVVAGDVLEAKSTAVGTGLADPGGTLFVTIARA